jgi:cation transport regulator ChaB
MPKDLLSKFPGKAKKLWEAAYRNARSTGKDIETSSKIAMGAVKKAYKKRKGVWIKKHLNVKLHLVKHGWIFPSYKFELELSNNKWDCDNQRVSEDLLSRMVSEDKISSMGDVDHERYYAKRGCLDERNVVNQDTGTEGLYFLDSYKYDNGSVKAIVSMNKKHPLFNKYLSLHQEGKFLYASAEFPNATVEDGNIVDADEMLWSITDNPAGDVGKGVLVV